MRVSISRAAIPTDRRGAVRRENARAAGGGSRALGGARARAVLSPLSRESVVQRELRTFHRPLCQGRVYLRGAGLSRHARSFENGRLNSYLRAACIRLRRKRCVCLFFFSS